MRTRKFLVSCLMLGLAGATPAQASNDVGPVAQTTGLKARIGTVLQREGVEGADANALQPAPGAANVAPEPGHDAPGFHMAAGVLVRFRDPEVQALAADNAPPPAALLAALEAASGASLSYARAMSGGMHVLRFAAPRPVSEADRIAEQLSSLVEVERVELDYIVAPKWAASDPRLSEQWNLFPPLNEYSSGMDAMTAWRTSTGSPDVVVAVIDTGILNHPEFDARVLPGYDFISDPMTANDGGGRDADPSDPGDFVVANECWEGSPAAPSSWHGTHVGGIIAANGSNAKGIAGVVWNSRILPVRVLGKCGGSFADIVDGIRWAAGLPVPGVPANPQPAQVLNLSLGGYSIGCIPSMAEAINDVANVGGFVTLAAGNERRPIYYATPANCARALTVMAVDQYAELASYSNYSVDGGGIAAPGGDISRYGRHGGILSAVSSGERSPGLPDYAFYDGTSMAAPHVAGVAALMLSVNPALIGDEVNALIQQGARDFAPNSHCAVTRRCGVGLADAPGALDAAQRLQGYALVQEFYNSDLKHYFRTASKDEAAGVARGAAGRNWSNTADFFYVWVDASRGAQPVCRFYGTPGVGPNSHFYTVSAKECEMVKRDPGWTFEGLAFYAMPPVAGACPEGTVPVYRAYNNRWRENDSNHRFTTDLHVYRTITTTPGGGWIGEGVAMCAAG